MPESPTIKPRSWRAVSVHRDEEDRLGYRLEYCRIEVDGERIVLWGRRSFVGGRFGKAEIAHTYSSVALDAEQLEVLRAHGIPVERRAA